ncbi:MAG: hypothetical protein JO079_13885 [Frankiaceae bacterium]|nr:hypothetical protein [Frankiaceae bacterium]
MTDVEGASRAEAIVAGVHHHHHHPADPNVGVVRVRVDRRTVFAAIAAAAVTAIGLVLLGIAIGAAH